MESYSTYNMHTSTFARSNRVSTYGTKALRGLEDSFALQLGVCSEYMQAC